MNTLFKGNLDILSLTGHVDAWNFFSFVRKLILESAGSDELGVRHKNQVFSQIAPFFSFSVFSPNLGRGRGLGGAEVGGDCDRLRDC